MKFIYPAVFLKQEDGTYTGYFPDLEMCCCKGDTLEDALDDARDAANAWISLELTEEEPDLPTISDIEKLSEDKENIVRNICINVRFYDGWDE